MKKNGGESKGRNVLKMALSAVLVVSLAPVCAYAETEDASTQDQLTETALASDQDTSDLSPLADGDPIVSWTEIGTNCEWMINAEGTLIIRPKNGTGEGTLPEMTSSSDEGTPWRSYASKIKAAEVQAGVKAGAKLTGMFAGCLMMTSARIFNLDTSATTDMASFFSNCFRLAEVIYWDAETDQGIDTRNVKNLDYMFSSCEKLTSIDLSHLALPQTEDSISARKMFNSCQALSEVALPTTAEGVISQLDGMFALCPALTTINNLSGFWNTSVANTEVMFQGCSSLQSLDLSGIDFSATTNMSYMFESCTKLASVTFPASESLKPTKLAHLSSMFINCTSLTSVDTFLKFDFSHVENTSDVFKNCSSLLSLDLTVFNYEKFQNPSTLLTGCLGLKSLTLPAQVDFSGAELADVAWKDTAGVSYANVNAMLAANAARESGAETYIVLASTDGWTIYDRCEWQLDENGQLTIRPLPGMTSGTLPLWETSPWAGNTNIVSVKFTGSVVPTTCASMFKDCTALTSFDFTNLAVTRETDITDMLDGCTALTYLTAPAQINLLHANIRESLWIIPDTTTVFDDNILLLAHIIASESGYTTYRALALTEGYTRCGTAEWKIQYDGKLTVHPIPELETGVLSVGEESPWAGNTSIVYVGFTNCSTDTLEGLFAGCTGMRNISFEGLDTSQVTSMASLLSGCKALNSASLSSLDLSNVTNAENAFSGCTSLTLLRLPAQISLSNTGLREAVWQSSTGAAYASTAESSPPTQRAPAVPKSTPL